LRELFDELNKLIKFIGKSGPAMQALEKLQQDAGEKPLRLLRMATTRWNAAFLVMRRAAQLARHIPVACAMTKKQQNINFDLLSHAAQLLEPIYQCTQRLQSDECTIQHVYLEMKNIIAVLTANESPMRNEAHTLARLIRERFAYIFIGAHFEPVYLVACTLCPEYLGYLSDVEKRTAKSVIIKQVSSEASCFVCLRINCFAHLQITTKVKVDMNEAATVEALTSADVVDATQKTIGDGQAGPSRPSKFSHLTKNASSLASSSLINVLKDRIKKEVHTYFDTGGAGAGEQANLVQFWLETLVSGNLVPNIACAMQHFPHMSAYALKVLLAPATNACVERLFSDTGMCSTALKNRTRPALLETKILCSKNVDL
jgi:hypothetical protein